MSTPLSKASALAIAVIASVSMFAAQSAFAAAYTPDNVTVTAVAVNGGADTQNPGTTCVTVSVPLVAACPAGYVAIQNNNKQLLAAALLAKATSSKVMFIYDDSAGPFHCPGRVFTPCSVISIELK
jgi:hypothetical protein